MAMILIKNSNIIDGTGKPAFKADILIKDEKIAAIGNFQNKQAEVVIDGLGLAVVPGFIDVNTDSDHHLSIFTNPLQEDFLRQGVTTVIGGHCGASLAPLLYGSLKSIRKWADTDQINVDWRTVGELKETLKKIKIGVNFATLAGHSTIRRDLVGEEIRDLTESELLIFQNAITQAMEDGALGLSSGLGYAHSKNTPYFELKRLLSAVAKRNGVYTTHLRDERANILKSVEETTKISEEIGVPTVISHFRPIIGFEKEFKASLSLMESKLNVQNIYFDANPFSVSIIHIYTLLPPWVQQRNLENMLDIINDSEQQRKILDELNNTNLHFEDLTIAEAQNNDYIVGKTLKEFSESRNLSPEAGLLNLMEITKMKASLFYNNINPEILAEIIFHPRSLIGSNSASLKERDRELDSERSNTFSRFLEMSANKNLPFENAIQKITSLPAKIFRINKRGLIQEGYFADLAMLKNSKLINLIINGKLAIQDGQLTNSRNGRPL